MDIIKSISRVLCILTAGLLMFSGGLSAQQLVMEDGKAEKITDGHQFTEGPYWDPSGFLVYSDIPANAIYKWTPDGGKELFLEPSGHSNGITADTEGRMLLAQHDGMVSRVTEGKEMETLASSYMGKRLNSPNDLVVHSNGTIYFTDPPFGVSDDNRELDFSGVYRMRAGQEPELIYDEFELPNGAVLSPGEDRLYVNNTQDGNIVVFDVNSDGSVENPRDFASVGESSSGGAADGMVVDTEGRLYTTSSAGITVFGPDGEKIKDIEIPERATNMEWGGEENRSLFITSPSGVYRLPMKVTGFKK